MRRGHKRALAILFLLGSAVSALTQTTTDINARGVTATEPSVRILGGSGTGPGDQKSLEAVLTVHDPSQLIPGKTFDFELLITNRSHKAIVVPQSLNWEDVDTGGADWRYRSAIVGLQVEPDGSRQRASIGLKLELYSSDDRPSTELVLKPGDAIRILGSARLPVAMSINGKPILQGKLAGSFTVTSNWLHPAPTPAVPEGYSSEDRTIFSAESVPTYPVTLLPAR